MNLKFKIEQVESLIEHTKMLLDEGEPIRDGFNDAGILLASQYGAGVYLMSSMKDEEWTSRVVFAEHCNPNAEDFLDEIAASADGTEETVELISLDKLQSCVAVAKACGKKYLTIPRTSTVSL